MDHIITIYKLQVSKHGAELMNVVEAVVVEHQAQEWRRDMKR
jgi:hypothetical protein